MFLIAYKYKINGMLNLRSDGTLTLKTLKYRSISHGDQKYFFQFEEISVII